MPYFAPPDAKPEEWRLRGTPPYRAWMLHQDQTRSGPWGVMDSTGINCLAGPSGAVMVRTRDDAEAIIRAVGRTSDVPWSRSRGRLKRAPDDRGEETENDHDHALPTAQR